MNKDKKIEDVQMHYHYPDFSNECYIRECYEGAVKPAIENIVVWNGTERYDAETEWELSGKKRRDTIWKK